MKYLEYSKEIINFKKNEEKKEMNNNPEFDDIKVFSDEIIGNENNIENKEDNSINKKNNKYNTILKTIKDDFKKIKNNVLNFIPQIEINQMKFH